MPDLVADVAFSGSSSLVPTWYKQRNRPPGFFGQYISFLPLCTRKCKGESGDAEMASA